MPRKKKQQIKSNNVESFEGLLQEVYNDACANIKDAQTTINEMTNAAEPEDVDDLTKVAKERGNLLKVKDSAMKVKLEVAKLQNDSIKHNGDLSTAVNERRGGKVDFNDFRAVRKMIEDGSKDNDTTDFNG